MCARGHGRVLNVASIAAFQPVPPLATYAATKAYVLSLTESLPEERGAVIKVPGIVKQAATLASPATPKWLLRHMAGTLARKAV
jgi:short-subunit dehydrogenase